MIRQKFQNNNKPRGGGGSFPTTYRLSVCRIGATAGLYEGHTLLNPRSIYVKCKCNVKLCFRTKSVIGNYLNHLGKKLKCFLTLNCYFFKIIFQLMD